MTAKIDRPGSGRTEVEESWRRSCLHGVSPSMSMSNRPAVSVDEGSPLVAAASAALREATSTLHGTEYTFILGDHAGRVLRRFGGDMRVERVFQNHSVETGVSFREEDVGTNAIGTALELRRPVVVHAGDHFNEQLRMFSCLGHPVVHPLTRRVVGVLDLTGVNDVTHPLIVGLMRTVVADIQSRLLDASKASGRHLLTAFRVAAARGARPIVAVGQDMLLANRHALDLLRSEDFAMLRGLVGEASRADGARRLDVDLVEGERVGLTVEPVDGHGHGAVVMIDPRPAAARSLPSAARGADPTATATAQPPAAGCASLVVVAGPPGSGRTTAARELAGAGTVATLPAHDGLVDGGRAWLAAFEQVSAAGSDVATICIDDVDLLPEPLVGRVVDLAGRDHRPALVVTLGPIDALTGRAAVLASMATHATRLVALSQRRQEIHGLALRLLQEVKPGCALRLTPPVIEALCAHHWPGNLHELRAVMRHVAQRRTLGDVVLADLPEGYQSAQPGRRLRALERAERDAIIAALGAHGGNKTQAASTLGISRTTLYARMRQLRIAG